MVQVYKDEDLYAVYRQKSRVLGVFWALTLTYIAFCVAWLV